MAQKRVFAVYLIKNLLDGKRYIGKTSGPSVAIAVEARWQKHLKLARAGGGWYLHRAIRSHGADNFGVNCLCACKTEWGAFAFEQKEIARLAPEYNLTNGGEGVAGLKWTEKSRAAITGRKGRPLSPEHLALLAASNRGRLRSAATRAKISKALTGKKRSLTEEQRRTIGERSRARFAGKPLTHEHARKISLGKLGQPYKRTKFTAAMLARKAARATGQKHYSGNPCKECHGTLRYVSTRQCVECHRLWQMNYMPKWRHNRTEMHHV